MADEMNQEVVNEPQENSEPQYTESEQKALAQGWVPKEQYTGSAKWRDADEFLERGEFFTKIEQLNKRNQSLEVAINETKNHLKKVRETEYKKALETLRTEKRAALNEGDLVKADEIDEKIQETRDEQKEELAKMEAAPPQPTAPAPQFVAWVNRNPWYQNDRVMKAAADTIADEIVAEGERNPTRVLEEVEKRIKKEFPNKFVNPNRGKPGSVEGTSGASSRGKSDTFQLTPEETQVMNKLVRHGVMTKEEYIADIKASRGN